MKYQRIEVERNAEVTQCYSTRNSKMRYFSRGGRQGELQVDVDHVQATQRCLDPICAHYRTLIVSYKVLVDAIKKEKSPLLKIPEYCAVAHFGNLRGIDRYKDFDAVVVIGRHQFPCSVVENMAAALWWDSPTALHLPGELEEQLRGYSLNKGKLGVFVPVHPDKRVQGLLELLRERETLQAIDRLRLIHSEQKKPVYLLSNLPLPLRVDNLVSWKTLTSKPRRLNRLHGYYNHEVIPLSPKFLHARHGDLFATLAAAKKWSERLQASIVANDGFGVVHTHSSVGVGDAAYIDVISRDSRLLSYRLQGESGKPKKCVCPTRMSIAEVKRHLAAIHQAAVTMPPVPRLRFFWTRIWG